MEKLSALPNYLDTIDPRDSLKNSVHKAFETPPGFSTKKFKLSLPEKGEPLKLGEITSSRSKTNIAT